MLTFDLWFDLIACLSGLFLTVTYGLLSVYRILNWKTVPSGTNFGRWFSTVMANPVALTIFIVVVVVLITFAPLLYITYVGLIAILVEYVLRYAQRKLQFSA